MIIGTAGHIDHGKTSLVKALTGVDADRLKEEKARGITIDLGFAYKPLEGGATLGFVDVPGHEKLIHNMLAGATGIDYVVLVVAADDGPMPQTREHLAILDLLGLSRGVVALSKCDLTDAAQIDRAREQVRALLAGTALASSAVIALSSATGAGIAELDRHLRDAAAAPPLASAQQRDGNFRLAVDRCFTLAGIGTVVTGTVFSGRVEVGDKLLVAPRGLAVRVRGIHAQNHASRSGHAGQRCALNLTGGGLQKSDIARGDWIVAEAALVATDRIDVRLKLLAAEAKPLRPWTPLRLHLGACEVGARAALLEGDALAPGASALVQLVLERPIGAWRGDRFVVRDTSAQRTLGGGVVVDPIGAPRGRRRPQRLAVLAALEQPRPGESLDALLALDTPAGVDLHAFARAWNLAQPAQDALFERPSLVRIGDGIGLSREAWQRQQAALLAALDEHHRRSPDAAGATLDQMQAATKLPAAGVAALASRLVAGRSVQRSGPYLRLPGHEPTLAPADQALWERLRVRLADAAGRPPKLSALCVDLAVNHEQARQLLRRVAAMGKVYHVSDEYFVLPQELIALAREAQALAEQHAQKLLTVGKLREATGVSRHLSLPLLEFFDRVGLTRRVKDGRRLRRGVAEVFGASE